MPNGQHGNQLNVDWSFPAPCLPPVCLAPDPISSWVAVSQAEGPLECCHYLPLGSYLYHKNPCSCCKALLISFEETLKPAPTSLVLTIPTQP